MTAAVGTQRWTEAWKRFGKAAGGQAPGCRSERPDQTPAAELPRLRTESHTAGLVRVFYFTAELRARTKVDADLWVVGLRALRPAGAHVRTCMRPPPHGDPREGSGAWGPTKCLPEQTQGTKLTL